MTVTKIMSANQREFLRSLAFFEPDRSFDTTKTTFSFTTGGGEATITYKVMPDRKVTGLLSLPQLEVTIDFLNVDEASQKQFINDFDIAFQRGGG